MLCGVVDFYEIFDFVRQIQVLFRYAFFSTIFLAKDDFRCVSLRSSFVDGLFSFYPIGLTLLNLKHSDVFVVFFFV